MTTREQRQALKDCFGYSVLITFVLFFIYIGSTAPKTPDVKNTYSEQQINELHAKVLKKFKK